MAGPRLLGIRDIKNPYEDLSRDLNTAGAIFQGYQEAERQRELQSREDAEYRRQEGQRSFLANYDPRFGVGDRGLSRNILEAVKPLEDQLIEEHALGNEQGADWALSEKELADAFLANRAQLVRAEDAYTTAYDDFIRQGLSPQDAAIHAQSYAGRFRSRADEIEQAQARADAYNEGLKHTQNLTMDAARTIAPRIPSGTAQASGRGLDTFVDLGVTPEAVEGVRSFANSQLSTVPGIKWDGGRFSDNFQEGFTDVAQRIGPYLQAIGADYSTLGNNLVVTSKERGLDTISSIQSKDDATQAILEYLGPQAEEAYRVSVNQGREAADAYLAELRRTGSLTTGGAREGFTSQDVLSLIDSARGGEWMSPGSQEERELAQVQDLYSRIPRAILDKYAPESEASTPEQVGPPIPSDSDVEDIDTSQQSTPADSQRPIPRPAVTEGTLGVLAEDGRVPERPPAEERSVSPTLTEAQRNRLARARDTYASLDSSARQARDAGRVIDSFTLSDRSEPELVASAQRLAGMLNNTPSRISGSQGYRPAQLTENRRARVELEARRQNIPMESVEAWANAQSQTVPLRNQLSRIDRELSRSDISPERRQTLEEGRMGLAQQIQDIEESTRMQVLEQIRPAPVPDRSVLDIISGLRANLGDREISSPDPLNIRQGLGTSLPDDDSALQQYAISNYLQQGRSREEFINDSLRELSSLRSPNGNDPLRNRGELEARIRRIADSVYLGM